MKNCNVFDVFRREVQKSYIGVVNIYYSDQSFV